MTKQVNNIEENQLHKVDQLQKDPTQEQSLQDPGKQHIQVNMTKCKENRFPITHHSLSALNVNAITIKCCRNMKTNNIDKNYERHNEESDFIVLFDL